MAKNLEDWVAADGKVIAGRTTEHPWTVLLCDPSENRRDLVSEIIKLHGAQAIPISVAWDLRKFDAARSVALLAVGDSFTTNAPDLELINGCKTAGLTVIAYEDGVKRWPMRSKCLPLVAGAIGLLDSNRAEFGIQLREVLERAFKLLGAREWEQNEIRSLMSLHGMIGVSSAIANVFKAAIRFSHLSDLAVLITGESGTGKELLARAIFKMDPKRKAGPLLTINCAAVNPALIESELFGHRRGAFTGAERDRKGWIRAADGGVLFLDEIGELELGLQGKLLRVLQENSLLSVGEENEVHVNVRFIAATNRNLRQLVAEGKFRADLFHRLRVLHIEIPPLRERPTDLPVLIEHFLSKHQALGAEPPEHASADFLEAIWHVDLPGNVRQLENLVREALVNHQGRGDLDLNDLPPDVLLQLTGLAEPMSPTQHDHFTRPSASSPPLPHPEIYELVKRILGKQGWNLSSALSECERNVFQIAMEHTDGNQSRAARLLGITPRSIYNKLRKHQLHA